MVKILLRVLLKNCKCTYRRKHHFNVGPNLVKTGVDQCLKKTKKKKGGELGFKESRSMEAPWTMKMQWTFFNMKKPNFIKHTFLDSILGMSKIVRFKVSWMGVGGRARGFFFLTKMPLAPNLWSWSRMHSWMKKIGWTMIAQIWLQNHQKKEKTECYDDPCVLWSLVLLPFHFLTYIYIASYKEEEDPTQGLAWLCSSIACW